MQALGVGEAAILAWMQRSLSQQCIWTALEPMLQVCPYTLQCQNMLGTAHQLILHYSAYPCQRSCSCKSLLDVMLVIGWYIVSQSLGCSLLCCSARCSQTRVPQLTLHSRLSQLRLQPHQGSYLRTSSKPAEDMQEASHMQLIAERMHVLASWHMFHLHYLS